MSTKERHALALLIGVGLLGHGVRLLAVGADTPPGGVSLITKSSSPDLATHRARSAAAGRPLRDNERIDLNRATKAELTRLPGVGPTVAKAILKQRTERGGFASLAELDSVPGVGHALLAKVLPNLALDDTSRVKARRPPPSNRGYNSPPPGPLPVTVVKGPPDEATRPTGGQPINLNAASETDLLALPGIGPTRAKAIVAYRQANGPFASVQELEKVPGLPTSLARRLASQVVVP